MRKYNYMRNFVNQKTRILQPSGIRKFFDIEREMEGAISLGVGEPDFVTPWPVRSAAISSIQKGYTQYTANRGMAPLLELISRYLETRFSLTYDPKHILVTVGASEAIDLVLRACTEPGDEILIPDPAYVSYAPCALLSDGVPVAVECREEDGFLPTQEALEAAITPRSKILILTYPNNPTGAIADRTALEKIAAVVEKHDLLVVSDEIYAELTYGQKHVSFASLPGMKERTVYVGGFSKAFAMTAASRIRLRARGHRPCRFQDSSIHRTVRAHHGAVCGDRSVKGRLFRRLCGGGGNAGLVRPQAPFRIGGAPRSGADLFSPARRVLCVPLGQGILSFGRGVCKQALEGTKGRRRAGKRVRKVRGKLRADFLRNGNRSTFGGLPTHFQIYEAIQIIIVLPCYFLIDKGR